MTAVASIGRHSYHGIKFDIHDYQEPDLTVSIGSYCSIAEDVEFLPGGMHQTDRVSTYPWHRHGHDYPPAELRGPITIGNDVWICRGVRILGGVTIGNGAIIGAYAVVASDVPAYHVAVGNPAHNRPRPLHAAHTPVLNRIAWWDWPDDDPRLHDVRTLSVAEFVAKHG